MVISHCKGCGTNFSLGYIPPKEAEENIRRMELLRRKEKQEKFFEDNKSLIILGLLGLFFMGSVEAFSLYLTFVFFLVIIATIMALLGIKPKSHRGSMEKDMERLGKRFGNSIVRGLFRW
ncbi:MAG: hypothetical protein HY267_05615 [Deltaproteobacteria bacterium]|nr:hypothetical protein [Deltaproteobacteria bacterium]